MHRVNIKYKPDKENPEGQEITQRFQSKEIALAFRDRQRKLPQVISAEYLGDDPHAKSKR